MNSQGFQQVQKQSQSVALSPKLQNALKILQAPAAELQASILEELQSNPLLEELAVEKVTLEELENKPSTDEPAHDDEANFDSDDYRMLEHMAEDLQEQYDGEYSGQPYSAEDEKRREYFMNSLTDGVSLQQHLIEQAQLTDCTETERRALLHLIGSLDDNGFLTESIADTATTLQLPTPVIEQASALLKSFDPPGIGAGDLQDCLLIQLELNGQSNSVATRIIRDHFTLLTRRRIPELAQKLSLTTEIIHEAMREIARLDPAPGRRFATDTNTAIEPDVTVYKDEYDQWHIELNTNFIPRLRISSAYKAMLARGNLSKNEREFMIERMRSGKFLINSIEQRQQTIERITKEILRLQKDFFEAGITKLRPMTMDTIAQAIDVHETTVSRAIANKYIRTPQGVFPFKYFFTTGYTLETGESVSNKTIKDMIQQIIANETTAKPLSDQAIVDILAGKNIEIARRTIAKYREELGILPTHLRRQY